MKYCPRCKLRMPGEQTLCQKCNGPLRTIGGSPADSAQGAGTAPGGGDDLALQLQGLQHEVQKSRQMLIISGALAIVLSMLLLGMVTILHFYHVFQFATVDQLDVRLVDGSPGEAEIEFRRTDLGKLEFLRESAGRTETLIDHGSPTEDPMSSGASTQFTWSGGEAADFAILVRTREGWSIAEKKWVARGGKIDRAD